MVVKVLTVITAYLVGSLPTGYIFGRVLKRIDIRKYGSGNVGATNVFRTVGKVPGIVVLIIDLLKGLAAVTLVPAVFHGFSPEAAGPHDPAYIYYGAAAIAGHIWTVFLGFKGGKGVATTAGVMMGLAPWIFLACFGVWITVVAIWKYVSLASITAATALPLLAAVTGRSAEFVVFCAVLCLVGVHAHRGNIKRLIQGTEKKIVKSGKS